MKPTIFITLPTGIGLTSTALGVEDYSHKFLAIKIQDELNKIGYGVEILSNARAEQLTNHAVNENYFNIAVGPLHAIRAYKNSKNIAMVCWEFPDIPNFPINNNVLDNWAQRLKSFDKVFTFNGFSKIGFEKFWINISQPIEEIYLEFGTCLDKNLSKIDAQKTISIPKVLVRKTSPEITLKLKNALEKKPRKRSLRVISFLKTLKNYYSTKLRKFIPDKAHWIIVKVYQFVARNFLVILVSKNEYSPMINAWITTDLRNILVDENNYVVSSWLNPRDRRKNFQDLVRNFLMFEHSTSKKNVIFLFKIIGSEAENHYAVRIIEDEINNFPDRECTFILIGDYLSEIELHKIRHLTDLYVNFSSAEGICLPAVEHAVCGINLLIPKNSSFPFYFDSSTAKFYETRSVPTNFPRDRGGHLTTSWHVPEEDSFRISLLNLILEIDSQNSRCLRAEEYKNFSNIRLREFGIQRLVRIFG